MECRDDCAGDPVGQFQNLGERRVDGFAPELIPRGCIHQAHGDADPLAATLQAALHKEPDIQPSPDLGEIAGLGSCGGGMAVDHEEQPEAAEPGGDIFGQPVAERIERGIAAKIAERQDRNAGSIGRPIDIARDGHLIEPIGEDVAIERLGPGIGCHTQFLLQRFTTPTVELEGFGPIATPRQQPHHRTHHRLAQAIAGQQLPAEADRRCIVFGGSLAELGDPLQGQRGQRVQALALRCEPGVAFRRHAVESLQQVAGIERKRRGGIRRRQMREDDGIDDDALQAEHHQVALGL